MSAGRRACASVLPAVMRCAVSLAIILVVAVAERSASPALPAASPAAVLPTAAHLRAGVVSVSGQPGEHSGHTVPAGNKLTSPTITKRTAPAATKHTAPTIINKLRDVSEPSDASRERDDAAEELDSDQSRASARTPRDGDDADEHDDYGERPDGAAPGRAAGRPRSSALVLPSAALAASGEDFYDWPEALPTPLAQTGGATGKQRSDGTYVVIDSEEYPCVLAYFSSTITIFYPTNGKDGAEDIKSAAMSPPSDATVSGTCDREAQVASLEITWRPGTFIISFAYDPLTDSWYVSSFQFAFNSGNAFYAGSKTEKEVVVRSEEERRFWTTSHARSFRCSLLHDIPLAADAGRFSGSVHFDEVRVQALTYGDRFKTPKHCMHRVQRSEKVPLIVGSTLAALTAVTIGTYAAIRYYKIKKVQYDTMQ